MTLHELCYEAMEDFEARLPGLLYEYEHPDAPNCVEIIERRLSEINKDWRNIAA